MTLPASLRALLACPKCHGVLSDGPRGGSLDCAACGLRFVIQDGIPVLLIAEATPLVE